MFSLVSERHTRAAPDPGICYGGGGGGGGGDNVCEAV